MGPELPALPEDGDADWWVFVEICHETLLSGFTIVKETGIASRSATRHEGEPPAATVICPNAGRLSGPLPRGQLVTAGGEHVADADGGDGAVGEDEAPEPPLQAASATASKTAETPRMTS